MSLPVSRSFPPCLRRTVFLLAAGGLAFAASPSGASGWTLPFWSGEVHGQASPLGDTGPQLAWTFSPGSPSAGVRTLAVGVENPATHLRATAVLDAATGDGSWRIEEGRVDVGPWMSAASSLLGKELAGLTAEGTLTISGEGLIRDGKPSGVVKIAWADGAVRHAGQGWALEGIAVNAEAEVGALPEGAVPVTLAVKTISTSRFGARNLAVEAVLNGTKDAAVKKAQIEIAGGTVETDPFTVPLSPPSLKVHLRMKRVGLQDVVALVPTMLADARGRISGELVAGWNEADGLQVGIGTLDLDEIEPTSLRLSPKPGFLTAKVPAHFVFFPKLHEVFPSWFAPENPAYATLTDIEMGRIPLKVDTLKVRLSPDGDEHGRSASVAVVAHPEQEQSVVKEVVFTINVAGPLSQVLKLGMSERISFARQ